MSLVPHRLLVLILLSIHCHSSSATNSTLNKPPNLKTIFLLGERNSGTNYIEGLLKPPFRAKYAANHKYPFARGSPVFWFKHMFRHDLLTGEEQKLLRSRRDILWILVVRGPCDWADGMFRKPWHMCDPKHRRTECKVKAFGKNFAALRNVDRLTFVSRMEYWDNEEARHSQNFTYPGGVMELRAHKLRLMMQLQEAVGPRNFKVAHLSEIEKAPEAFIQSIISEFGLTPTAGRRKPKPSVKTHSSKGCYSTEEWKALEEKTDWDLEAHFGWDRSHCNRCSEG